MRFFVPLLCLGLLGLAQAQAVPTAGADSAWTLASAQAEGSTRFPEADIVAASGMKAGAKVTLDDFKRAADRLLASGAFERVAFRYSPAGNGIKVVFQVEDSSQFLSVSFDNFVWCTDRELTEFIRKHVPLFHGELALEGDMRDRVTDALQAFLAERDIPGEVRFQLQAEQPGNANAAGVFWVEGIEIPVRSVDFPGAAPDDLPLLQVAARPLLGSSFRRSATETFSSHLLPVYFERGFLKARFAPPSITLVPGDPRHPAVAVAFLATPGPQYRLSAVRSTGNRALDSWELGRLLTAKIGAPADLGRLDADLEKIKQAYLTRGYLRAEVRIAPSYDESVPAVSFELQVQEGSQYKFASLELEGLQEPLQSRVREVWSLREGEAYDPNYIAKFLKSAAPLLGPGAVTRAEPAIDDRAKTVQVLLHFDFQKPIRENPQPASGPRK